MRTVVLSARVHTPTITLAKLRRLGGPGIAYVTDTLGFGRRLMPGHANEWEAFVPDYRAGETLEDALAHVAAQGYDILYRVSSIAGRTRYYKRKGNAYGNHRTPADGDPDRTGETEDHHYLGAYF